MRTKTFDHDELVEKYKQTKDISICAKHFNISEVYAKRLLIQYGLIESKGGWSVKRLTKQDIKNIQEWVDRGETWPEISRRFGASPITIKRTLASLDK